MGNVLKRKDNTSIFCSAHIKTKHTKKIRYKIFEITIAFVLIISGVALITFPF